ncbi:MAG: DUF4433 domain-containing protein [Candidatus Cloacimonetes bacterium]|nr:DUF4433 domain-containing protein [Candidatus Cloacimonadota bacterium]
MNPSIYHIVHVDRLASILEDGYLYCEAIMQQNPPVGTQIGMNHIKQRRRTKELASHPGLNVGDCVPFYFCPRSIMLYLMYRKSHDDISYRGGQEPIIHLVAEVQASVNWADKSNLRWAITSTNAGATYFDDYSDLHDLNRLNWAAINSREWKNVKEAKQAEFLMEKNFPWILIAKIGVYSTCVMQQVQQILYKAAHKPQVAVKPDWYY